MATQFKTAKQSREKKLKRRKNEVYNLGRIKRVIKKKENENGNGRRQLLDMIPGRRNATCMILIGLQDGHQLIVF